MNSKPASMDLVAASPNFSTIPSISPVVSGFTSPVIVGQGRGEGATGSCLITLDDVCLPP